MHGENGGVAPCWTLASDAPSCPNGGQALMLMLDQASLNAASVNTSVSCPVCEPGSTKPGC